MTLAKVKTVYVVCVLVISVLILAYPLSIVVVFPGGERFSELYLLGPTRLAEGYPFNVSAGESYKIYIDVSNHVGDLQYYRIYVKFRNQTEPLPSSKIEKASPLNESYEYDVFLSDGSLWEKEVTFSVDSVSFEGNICRVNELRIDNSEVSLSKVASWDPANSGFYYQLFFELWQFNVESRQFQYSNRYVAIWLNVTRGVL